MEIPSQHNVLHRKSSLQSPTRLVQCRRQIYDFISLGFRCIVYYSHILWEQDWCCAGFVLPPFTVHTRNLYVDTQTRHLVKFEFDEIKLSRWEAAFRAIAQHQEHQQQEAGKFPIRIFFGANDHWVDNELRDAFIYKYCDPNGPLAFGKEVLDLRARIDPSRDGDEASVVIPHDFSIGMFFPPPLFF